MTFTTFRSWPMHSLSSILFARTKMPMSVNVIIVDAWIQGRACILHDRMCVTHIYTFHGQRFCCFLRVLFLVSGFIIFKSIRSIHNTLLATKKQNIFKHNIIYVSFHNNPNILCHNNIAFEATFRTWNNSVSWTMPVIIHLPYICVASRVKIAKMWI